MTDYRALCAELFKACETLYKQSVTASHHQTITLSNGEHPIPIGSDMLAQDAVFGDLLHRTSAALAEQREGPSDEEIDDFIALWWEYFGKGYLPHSSDKPLVKAALARWGHQPTPPAEGEVGELLAELEVAAVTVESEGGDHEAAAVRRAAELLQRQQAKIESLEQQLETERMRVVACGIIATSDTPFSAAKNRNCHPDYWSASADDIARQIDELMRLRAQQTPVPVSERLPEPNVKVLAYYFNGLGNGRTICAIWVPAKSRSDDVGDDDDFLEYDEEDDKFYWPEGWYEVIENWDDLGWVAVNEGEVAYWQPLPKWPALLPQGEVE